MSSSATFSVPEVTVTPGGEEVVGLTVRNIGSSPEVFALVSTGLAQSWMHIDPPTLALPPGSFDTVRVSLRPPRSWAVGAGPTPFGVRVVAHGGIEDVTIADGMVTVLSFDERHLHLAQPVQRSRRRSEYDLVLENTGNSQASCRLTLIDPTRRVKGRFQPPSIGVDPGMTQPIRLAVVARRRRWRRERSLPFVVQASQDGRPPVEVGGTMLQETMVSGRSIGRLALALAAAGAIVGAWFGVVEPAIDDAAERAVAELSSTRPTSAPSVTDATGTAGAATVVDATENDPAVVTVTTVALAPSSGTASFDTRLEASAPIGEQGIAAYTVTGDSPLLVTGILFQNPNRDAGQVALLRNGDVLYKAALDNFTDFSPPLYPGFEFQPGDTVTLQITCQGIGDPTGQACLVGATLTGNYT